MKYCLTCVNEKRSTLSYGEITERVRVVAAIEFLKGISNLKERFINELVLQEKEVSYKENNLRKKRRELEEKKQLLLELKRYMDK